MQSNKYSLNKQDALKIGKGAIIAISGAFLTYLLSIIGTIDFGNNTVLVVPILTILINSGLKFIEGERGGEIEVLDEPNEKVPVYETPTVG